MPLVYEVTYDEGIEEFGGVPEVAELVRLWRDLAAAAPDGLPRLADLSPDALPALRDHLMLLEPQDGDYVYRHYGRAIVASVGFDMAGKRLSDYPAPVPHFVHSRYDYCCAERRPRLTVHHTHHAGKVQSWERLILPVAAPDGTLRLVVLNKLRRFRDEFLTAIFDSSPNGIFALTMVRRPDGSVEDAHIVSANRRIAEIFGYDDPAALVGRRILSVFPAARETGAWQRYLEVVDTQRDSAFEVDHDIGGEPRTFRILLVPFGDGLTVTVNDISDLKSAHATLKQQHATLAEANENLILLASGLATLAEEMEQSRRTLADEVKRRERLEERLRRMADTDALTGIANRRCFLAHVAGELDRSDRYGRTLSLIMIDIDHFKAINDTYGHSTGDKVLTVIADTLVTGVRASDHVARIGGEEFVVLLPETKAEAAAMLAERLKSRIRSAVIAAPDGDIGVTATFGVAERRPGEAAIDEIMARADSALYRGKALGRDRVVVADAPGSTALSD